MNREHAAFLDGGGETGKRIREFDWASTALGPIQVWSPTMKTTIGVMLRSRFPKAIAWGSELITFHNDAFLPILGSKPEAIGRPFSDVWKEAWPEIGPIAERAFKGEATFIEDFPLTIDRFGYPEQCYFTFCYSPIIDADGTVVAMMDTVVETTTKVEAERQSSLLNAELAHRMKNMLGIVAAIAQQTLTSVERSRDALPIFSGRLQALADVQALLTGAHTADASVPDIVADALAPHIADPGNFTISGPPVTLRERPALSLALAVNELATNAIKYGSLSIEGGKVAVTWHLSVEAGRRRFRFEWREHGGPEVTAGAGEGFGSRLLKRVVPADFGGTASLSHESTGVVYTVECDYDGLEQHG